MDYILSIRKDFLIGVFHLFLVNTGMYFQLYDNKDIINNLLLRPFKS